MNAGFRFHGRLRVQLVVDFVALLGDREEVGIGHHIERIARFFRAHPAANRSIVVTVCHGEKQQKCVEEPNRVCAHKMDLPSIVAHFRGNSSSEEIFRPSDYFLRPRRAFHFQQRRQIGCGKTQTFVIPFRVSVHGEPRRAACRGLSLFLDFNQREIPRFARNDKINYFFRSLLNRGLRRNPRRYSRERQLSGRGFIAGIPAAGSLSFPAIPRGATCRGSTRNL